jgi:GTP-binding protein
MFIDKVKIYLQAGRGGAGCVSFRREKFVPFGGPNGGNGGKGGDIYLKSDPSVSTLLDFTYRPHFKAQPGLNGMGKERYGAKGQDLVIKVPCGTIVYAVERTESGGQKVFVVDLKEPGSTALAARGGRGGRGNASFKTHTNTAPKISEKGEPGEGVTLELELKLIADIGIVGCPNAGKSTLISRITSACPKVADYPFTTLGPNLGVCKYKGKNFVVADIPGLIEGAHEGKGLGDEFLRHIERTSILLHLVDAGGYEGKSAYRNFQLINAELKKYSAELAKKPMIAALNKMDLSGSRESHAAFRKKLASSGRKIKILPVSCATGEGLEALQDKMIEMLSEYSARKCAAKDAPARMEFRKYVFEPEFNVKREGGVFIVSGKKVERFVSMTNFEQEEAARRLQNILKKMGIEKELVKKGVREGDTVKIAGYEFVYSGPPFAGAVK